MQEAKQQLRKIQLAWRTKQSPEQKAKRDKQIAGYILTSDWFTQASLVLAFMSTREEPDLMQVCQAAWQQGKRVALPKCLDREGHMAFYEVEDPSKLQRGMFSILEPNPALCPPIEDFSHGVCLVPGLCFDTEGYRIGYGKGYYDRFLEKYSEIKVGICYNANIIAKVPREPTDHSMDLLVTEGGVINLLEQK